MTSNGFFEERLEILLNQTDRLPFLFIGSGFSRRYLGLPSWKELLEHFASLCLPQNPLAYSVYKTKAGGNDYPYIAELIKEDFDKKWVNDAYKNQYSEADKEFVKNDGSPFKLAISQYLQDFKFIRQLSEQLQNEISMFKRLAKRSISGIITTNYDSLLEQLLPNYSVYDNQEQLLLSSIHGVQEIYKIHGSVSNPNSIVITRKDYEDFKSNKNYIVAKLMTLFVEHQVIFLGYSLGDSNIKEILKSITDCCSKENLERFNNRLFFVNWFESLKDNNIINSKIEFENGKGIPITQLDVSSYQSVFSALEKKRAKYDLSLLRNLKNDVYEIVLNNKPAEKYIAVSLENSKNSGLKAVAGVSLMNNQEYSMPNADDLYIDIVFDNQNYDSTKLIDKSLETLLNRYSRSLPVYKYILGYDSKTLPEYIIKFIQQPSLEQFFSDGIKKERKKNQLFN